MTDTANGFRAIQRDLADADVRWTAAAQVIADTVAREDASALGEILDLHSQQIATLHSLLDRALDSLADIHGPHESSH